MINGKIPPIARYVLFAANLPALRKKHGGIRPVAVGNVLRMLASKIAVNQIVQILRQKLPPVHLGVGVSGGCEAVVHAIREFVGRGALNKINVSILVKLYRKNSFNTVHRDHILEICERKAPSLLRLASLAYSSVNDFVFGDNLVQLATGVLQDDPLGPVLFALTVDDIARFVKSPVNIRYFDDATIVCPAASVHTNLTYAILALSAIGLEVNLSKSEIININSSNLNNDVSLNRSVLQDVSVTEHAGLSILGSQINPAGCRLKLDKTVEQLDFISFRLAKIDARPAFFLLRNCFSSLAFFSPCAVQPVAKTQTNWLLSTTA